MKDRYHHGNLKNELIEVGIQIISEDGFDHLSLRNISRQCGVSHNAIYRHFADKEQMIDCCREYVTKRLTDYLSHSIESLDPSKLSTIHAFGYAYISFYKEHPTYFSLLYRSSTHKIIVSTDESENNYPPFTLFQKVCLAYAEQNGMTKGEILQQLIRYWSLMQGTASLIISPNVELDGDWEDCLKMLF